MTDNNITTKTITELMGLNFFIPSYQRGYRWTKTNVLQLLDDIWEYRKNDDNQKSFYCLQPVVVRKHTWKDKDGNDVEGYELIDGQQRLTTIHRIITYLMLEFLKVDSLKSDYKKELYKIYYETRLESADFLAGKAKDESKPDLYYMSQAYSCIKQWFEDEEKRFGRAEKNRLLDVLLPELIEKKDEGLNQNPQWSIQVIWYEINDVNQKSEGLFTRLNRGKIPLTSAELIKARFVNTQSMKNLPSNDQVRKKTLLIQLWDEMEAQLNDPFFWAFITNMNQNSYSSKIELLFDTITDKKLNESDPLFSFVHFFDTKETSETLWKKWIEIEEIFRSLEYWYKTKVYHNKIGYLIATGTSIKKLVKARKERTKSEFTKVLNSYIAQQIPNNWQDLRYDKESERDIISNILLLHNLERMNGNNPEVFPFATYKQVRKSLEHIHAQNIEAMDPRVKEPWVAWLTEHLEILKELKKGDLKVNVLEKEIESALPNLEFNQFKMLARRIIELLPTDSEDSNDYLHKIENMALLGLGENVILSNSVFEVKRRKIVQMDKDGAFLPIATKRVFLKYFAGETNSNAAIWSREERNAYKKDINDALEPYLNLKKTPINSYEDKFQKTIG